MITESLQSVLTVVEKYIRNVRRNGEKNDTRMVQSLV